MAVEDIEGIDSHGAQRCGNKVAEVEIEREDSR
jgi:hypothetical protein